METIYAVVTADTNCIYSIFKTDLSALNYINEMEKKNPNVYNESKIKLVVQEWSVHE